jgi:hypothetical protein
MREQRHLTLAALLRPLTEEYDVDACMQRVAMLGTRRSDCIRLRSCGAVLWSSWQRQRARTSRCSACPLEDQICNDRVLCNQCYLCEYVLEMRLARARLATLLHLGSKPDKRHYVNRPRTQRHATILKSTGFDASHHGHRQVSCS